MHWTQINVCHKVYSLHYPSQEIVYIEPILFEPT